MNQKNNEPQTKKKIGLTFYKGWSPAQRLKSLKYVKQSQAIKLMPMPDKCVECGSIENLQSHVENYDFSVNVLPDVLKGKIEITTEIQAKLENDLTPMCRRCHLALHKKYNEEERKKQQQQVI